MRLNSSGWFLRGLPLKHLHKHEASEDMITLKCIQYTIKTIKQNRKSLTRDTWTERRHSPFDSSLSNSKQITAFFHFQALLR